MAITLPAALAGLTQRYDIHEEIGRGASGTVYRATDGFGGREVALKIAHPHIFAGTEGSPLARKAWLNEVHLAGKLRHRYIVETFDAGINDHGAYLAMEYLPHGTLEPFTRPGQLKPVGEILEIAYKCASALDYANRAGIIHRDIKPANLQYMGPGEVKVADFGAAYWNQQEATQVLDIGSLAYMAPELFRHWVTPQADIYALGVVLFRLLTGAYPFQGDNQAALMYQILHGERPPAGSLRGDIPAAVDGLLARMMDRDLEKRLANWGEAQAALGELTRQLAPDSHPEIPNAEAASGTQSVQADLYDRLRRLPLLEGLNGAELWELLHISRWYKVEDGTRLVKEGANAQSCYLLLKGEAQVTQQGKLIGWIQPGTLFGELAFAEPIPAPRAATVTAVGKVTLAKWPYAQLRTASPELQNKMLQVFFRLAAERLRKADEQYLSLYRQHMKDGTG